MICCVSKQKLVEEKMYELKVNYVGIIEKGIKEKQSRQFVSACVCTWAGINHCFHCVDDESEDLLEDKVSVCSNS